jgi:hydrogenase maturation protease
VNEARQGRTIILGLGNPVLRDDRVGLAVAEAVERLLSGEAAEGVEVVTASRGGFHLIDMLSGYERAVLVDCHTSENPVPGQVRQMSLKDVSGVARLVSVHDINAAEAFETADLLGIPMPRDVVIFAVDGADVSELSEKMTPAVEAAVEPLARRILALVRRPAE